MNNLDDPKLYKHYDTEDMLARIHEMPWQCQQAWQMATVFELPGDYAQVNQIVILGMGGSAIGGDLIRSLALAEAKIPILVNRDYSLPAFVNDKTLVIASSYSGNTEEILAAFERALKTDAKKLAITTGGKLKTMAEAASVPIFLFSYPAQPRAALGFSFIPLLGLLHKISCLSDKSAEVAETVSVLQKLTGKIDEKAPQDSNLAKQLAQKLFGRLAVIYGADMLAEVAHRWKTQINENSKAWAFYELFPELNHNSVVGYRFPPELTARAMVVLLHSDQLPHRIKLRYRATRQLLDQADISYQTVESEGTSPLSQIMSLVLFGDYVSYYLALLYEIDPSPVTSIACLKEELAKDTHP